MPKATKQIESSVCSQNAPLSNSLKVNEIGVGNGGIRLGINYSVSNETKRDK